jgi:hypothetical protein
MAQALNEVLLEPLPNPVLRAHASGVALPPGFEAWFGGCVVRDPLLRFQSVNDAWAPLDRVLAPPPQEIPSLLPPEPRAPAPPPLSESTQRWLVIGGSVAAAVVLFAVVVAARRGGDDPVATEAAAPTQVPSSTPAPEESVLFAPVPVAPQPVTVDAGDAVLAAVMVCLRTNDLLCAHAALDAEKKPSAYHVQVLYDLCEIEVDRECLAHLVKQHPKVDRRAQRERTLSVPGLASPGPGRDGGVGDEAHSLMASDPGAVRKLLEARVFGLKANRWEADMLWTVCHDEKDRTCCATIDALYPNLSHKAR